MFGDHQMFADNHLEIIIPREKLSYTHFLLQLLKSEKPDTAVPRKPLLIAQAILHRATVQKSFLLHHEYFPWTTDFQNKISGPAASASPGSLLEMQTPRCRYNASNTLEVWLSDL